MEKNVKTREGYEKIIRQTIKIIFFINFIDKLTKTMYNDKVYYVCIAYELLHRHPKHLL